MSLGRRKFNMITLDKMPFSRMTLNATTLCSMPQGGKKFNRMTLGRMTLGAFTLDR